MEINEFFEIFDYSHPYMDKIASAVCGGDFNKAKEELLRYFIKRKELCLSYSEPVTSRDKNFPLAYISRHFILSGPNEADVCLSSIFVTKNSSDIFLDIMPFIKPELSLMLMSRQKEADAAFFFSPHSIFPPCIILETPDGEIKVPPSKYAFVSAKEPDTPLSEEDIYEICEESHSPDEAYGVNTGRVYLAFDLSPYSDTEITSAHLSAKITLSETAEKKELLVFNVADSSWDNSLTWSKISGNVYSWESSPTGPDWNKPEGSDSEYLNVICRFNFARPMAAQYLSDVEKNKIYGERLLMLMESFAAKKPGGYNRVLETGERLSNFASVVGALIGTPAMTGDRLVSCLWVMYRDMKSLIENPDLGWSNWAVVRTSGLSKAVDFLPELKEYPLWRSKTRDTMEKLVDIMYSPDFSFRESGFSYSFWCIELFLSALHCAKMNNDPYSAFMRTKIEKALDASIDLIYPNFYDTNVGDSNYADKTAFLDYASKILPTKKLLSFLSGSELPSVCYSYSNTAVLRSRSMYLLFHATPFDGHSHADLLSICLYAHNRPLIADCGRYGYSKSDVSASLKLPASHSSVEIEGANPAAHSEAGSSVTLFASNKAFDFVKMKSRPYSDIDAEHTRTILLVKSDDFAVVSDFVTCPRSATCFKQNWQFMPHSNAAAAYGNKIETSFKKGSDIKLICPSADVASVENSIFSAGYGMEEKSLRGVFTKYGRDISFTTLLIVQNADENRAASAKDVSPSDNSFSAMNVNIDGKYGMFYTKNTPSGASDFCTFDGEALFIAGDRIFLAAGKTLTINSTLCIESEKTINNMYLHISGGIVVVESSSLHPTTDRAEAVKIYAPKTTHVLFNGSAVPFTLYSDYVYALGVN